MNVNTKALLDAELTRNPRATVLTPAQRLQVIDAATPLVTVAGGNQAAQIDRAIDMVLYGLPPGPAR